ncbi:MAG: amidohydrolase family protein, partial [Elusimicrobiota bacterium]
MITIKSATIYDGISEKPFNGDLSVRGERIAELSDNSHSEPGGRRISRFFPFTNVQGQNDKRLRGIKEINASGQLLLPGFIDIHSHADLNIYQEPSTNPKLRQGVTTEITGNCGFSIIPLPLGEMDKGEGYLARRVSAWIKMWKGIWGKPPAGYPDKKPAQNVFSLLGYGTLRYLISGLENRPFTRRETEFAKKIITASIKEGAVGLSLGMVYPPCAFSTKEELLIMATVVARAGGYLSVHLRNEGDAVEEAILEVIEIARRTGVRLQISHFKCYGRKNWHKFDGLLEIIEKENSRGLEINFDIYPYTAGST